MRQTSSQWERIEIQSEANANKMIEALLDYLVGQGDMSVSSAKNIVEEGMKQKSTSQIFFELFLFRPS
ncbi:MAG TPA: hypothetical protein VH796_11315 [Nitrososphaeraceae archaeon]